MNVLASTTLTIYRGESVDEWGDPTDVDTVHLTNVIANIDVKTVKAKTEATTMPSVIFTAECRVRSGLDINCNDIVKDNRTGVRWQVTATSQLQNAGLTPDLMLYLLRIS